VIAAWCNGRPIESWPLDSRAAHYGDGVFTTLRVHSGQLCWWPAHQARLRAACALLHLIEPDWTEIESVLVRAAAAPAAGVIKLMLVAQANGRGYARAWPSPSDVFVLVYPALALVAAQYRDGVVAEFAPALQLDGDSSGCKTLSRLDQVLAAALQPDRATLRCDDDGFVLGAQSANLFAQFGTVLATPPVGASVIAGVTRGTALQSPPPGFSVRVQAMHRDALSHADALILSNAVRGFVPVARIGERHYRQRDAIDALQRRFHPELGLPVP